MRKLAIIIIISFVISGCGINHTVKYVESPPTIVPTALSKEDVEFVILLALHEIPVKKKTEKMVEVGVENRMLGIAETIVEHLFGGNRARRQYWHYEGKVDKDIIYAGFRHKSIYMQVKIEYDENRVMFDIIETRNLQRKKGAIHKKALAWLNILEGDVRVALGRYDRLKNANW